jgi:hypothetical protein
VSSLLAGPGVGVIVGGMGGPLLGMAIPGRGDEQLVPLGTPRSAEGYAMPGSRFTTGAVPDRDPPGPPADDATGLP